MHLHLQGSAQSDLSGSFTSSKKSAFPTFYSIESGGQTNLSGGKRVVVELYLEKIICPFRKHPVLSDIL